MGAGARKRERTCIGCGAKSDKVGLLRIVRRKDGSVGFDAGGLEPGRGAYVCSAECLDSALSSRKLQRALRTAVAPEDERTVVADVAAACEGRVR